MGDEPKVTKATLLRCWCGRMPCIVAKRDTFGVECPDRENCARSVFGSDLFAVLDEWNVSSIANGVKP